jgi:hypothetical protein
MKKKLIASYKEWSKKGILPNDGLCNCLEDTEYFKTFQLFKPDSKTMTKLFKQDYLTLYWGCDMKWEDIYKITDIKQIRIGEFVCRQFTPLRETIVLLICAMHDEL